jgi:hypothetical protein
MNPRTRNLFQRERHGRRLAHRLAVLLVPVLGGRNDVARRSIRHFDDRLADLYAAIRYAVFAIAGTEIFDPRSQRARTAPHVGRDLIENDDAGLHESRLRQRIVAGIESIGEIPDR